MIENELRGATSRLDRAISYDVPLPLPKVGCSTLALKSGATRTPRTPNNYACDNSPYITFFTVLFHLVYGGNYTAAAVVQTYVSECSERGCKTSGRTVVNSMVYAKK